MFTWKEYLLLDHMSDVCHAAEGGFHGPLPPAIDNVLAALERSRGPLIWQKAARSAMWSLKKSQPQLRKKVEFCFVLFCLACNSQCACGGMTTAETAFPPSNLGW